MGTDLLYGGTFMNSTTSYDSIDYEEILESLKSDLDDSTLKPDSDIYVVRHSSSVKVGGKDFFPVMDYFYMNPVLDDKLTKMTVLEAKQLLFKAKEEFVDDFSKSTIDIIIGDLQAYTKNRSKRNENSCFLLFTKEDRLPIMLFFEEEAPKEEIFLSKVSDILDEITACFGEK